MKAVVHDRYGPPSVLQLRDVEMPDIAEDKVLVQVLAASVNAADWHTMTASPALVRLSEGLRRPRTPIGFDLAGRVEQVGAAVTDLKVGDEVFGTCRGAFAEYVSGRTFVPKPTNLTFEQAAAVPVAGLTALQALRDKGGLAAGQRVLVNGAGGGVGTFTVQIARALGAEVTGVTSTDRVELIRSIGAHHVIDYLREDFTRTGPYDLIVDMGGNRPIRACRRALRLEGTYVLVGADAGRGGPMRRLAEAAFRSAVLRQRVTFFISSPSTADLLTLKTLIESHEITPVIDRSYALVDTPEAIRHVHSGHPRGKVVVTVPG